MDIWAAKKQTDTQNGMRTYQKDTGTSSKRLLLVKSGGLQVPINLAVARNWHNKVRV